MLKLAFIWEKEVKVTIVCCINWKKKNSITNVDITKDFKQGSSCRIRKALFGQLDKMLIFYYLVGYPFHSLHQKSTKRVRRSSLFSNALLFHAAIIMERYWCCYSSWSYQPFRWSIDVGDITSSCSEVEFWIVLLHPSTIRGLCSRLGIACWWLYF